MQDNITKSPAAETSNVGLIGVEGVAQLLECCTRHVYRLCEMGLMPRPMKLGRLNRWSKRAILAWIDKGCNDCRKGADHE